MRVAVHREGLVGNVLRLRRAERTAPEAREDIAEVRRNLERAIGPTVSRALAARVLGISQTALDRWIESGDVPTVVARSGRREVPLSSVLELAEAVDKTRRTGAVRHPLASVLRERRAAAEQIDARTVLPARRGPGSQHGHRAAELQGLAYHRAVARRLDGETVAAARQRLRRWRDDGTLAQRDAERWDEILSRSPGEIAREIVQDSDRARRLRQSSPFAGALSEAERRRVRELVGGGG